MGNTSTVRTLALRDCRLLSSGMEQALAQVCRSRQVPPPKCESLRETVRVIDQVWRSRCKAIVDVPCGGGKSTWALARIADYVRRWQDPQCSPDSVPPAPNPIYLVVDTLLTGIDRLNELVGLLGVPSEYVGFYHSHWEDECRRLRGEDGKTFYDIARDRHICKDCERGHDCFYFNRNTEIAKKVVILTHEGFIRLHERGKIPCDRDIIIDEEPALYYTTMFSVRELTRFFQRLASLQPDTPSVNRVRELAGRLLDLANTQDKQRSTVRWTWTLSHGDRMEAIRAFERLTVENGGTGIMTGSTGSQATWEDMAELVLPESLDLIYRLGYSFGQGATTYVYCDGDKLSVCRDRIDFGIPNRVILLNGSAQVARHIYPTGMTVWNCPDIKPNYPNVTLHCLCGLPTKTWFKNDFNVRTLVAEAARVLHVHDPLFLAVNNLTDISKVGLSVIAMARSAFPLISDADIGQRGSTKGSNNWFQHRQGIIATSWFTDMSHYALCASVRHKRSYARDDLFQDNGKPKFRRGSKLASDDLNEEFLRQAADDIYQTIMRLACRHDSNETVDVVLLVPNIELLAYLGRLMPNIRVRSEDFSLAFADVLLNTEVPLSNEEMYRNLTLGKSSGKNVKRVQQIAAMFDWVKTKASGRRGNHNIWRPHNATTGTEGTEAA